MRGTTTPLQQRVEGIRRFFLIGAERSGSTLLRLLLDHHPEISCLGEFDFAFDGLDPDGGEPARDTYHRRLAFSRQFRYSGLKTDPRLECREAIPALFEDMQRQRGADKPIVGATIHRHFRMARSLWPEARFVHLMRDPRDVAPSVVAMGWAATSWHAMSHWIEPELEVEALARTVPEDHIAKLRFEDLVTRPEAELTRLCATLGVGYDPAMLSYTDRNSGYPAPDPAAAQRWRSSLPERDVREIEARAGSMMEARGYELSGLPPLRIGALRSGWIGLRNRAGLARARLATYGAGPVLAHAVGSRFGLAKLGERALRKIQDIDQRNLR